MSIDNIDDEIKCKVHDGRHWVPATIHSRYKLQFETHRMKENQLLGLINYRLDDSNTLHIVSIRLFHCLWSRSIEAVL